ncbi:RNA recognition motif 2-domain-containing protein [Xylariomycetidae sp. FL2044]|nr:RNA recognition motif 2-domain-containing protein [Xylariomycetidae sp. FL2044]
MTMPSTRDGQFHPTSPHSSSGAAESFKGTPDTRLTAFSPEDGSSKSMKAMGTLNSANRGVGPIKFAVTSPFGRNTGYHQENTVEKDPFVATSIPTTKAAPKLSPTASVFSPYRPSLVNRVSNTEQKRVQRVDNTGSVGFEHAQTASSFVEDRSAGRSLQPASPDPDRQLSLIHSALSTDLGLSRCLVVFLTDGGRVTSEEVEHYLTELERSSLPIRGSSRKICDWEGKTYIRFSNIRAAFEVLSKIMLVRPNSWAINPIPPREFPQVIESASGIVTAHEGQMYTCVFPLPGASIPSPSGIVDTRQLETLLKQLLQTEGDLFAFKTHPGMEGSIMSAVIEYCDNDTSLRAVPIFNNMIFQNLHICATLYRPDIPPLSSQSQTGVVSPARTTVTASDLANDLQQLSLSRSPSVASPMRNSFMTPPGRTHNLPSTPSYGMVPVVYQRVPISPPYVLDHMPARGHNMAMAAGNYSVVSPMTSPGSLLTPEYMAPEYITPRHFHGYSRLDGRRQNAMRVQRGPHHNANNTHNQVDVNRIREGADVRTTIMLRNIPNKVDQAMLKKIVDESSWGKYDFMYLRIDFANDCNVGYAFINFVDPLDIIEFVKARGNQRWNCFKSDKVAEISYATIQGKDCLVQKFRNSSVMLELEHYRPKLYYTSNGPNPENAGREERFPGPDNQSKMKRSCENAEHVGLFTPNAGQHYRDEQRRRRSQFDRGTRLAALEEYDYDTSLPPHFYSQ